ncbi:Arc family DNA-binding protein [Inquilinus limosus]|uniref:Arc family DNA-binding protein n=1 Tax=Inquilinus limosus TaxID=171674 RepID=UPI0013786A95
MEPVRQFTLRLPQSLFDQVKDRATVNRRDVNKEITYIVESYIDEQARKDIELMRQMHDRFQAKVQ